MNSAIRTGAIKNWKTFLVGLVASINIYLYQEAGLYDVEIGNTVSMVLTFLIGFFAKDADKSGT